MLAAHRNSFNNYVRMLHDSVYGVDYIVYNFVQHACLHTITHVTQVTTHIVVIKSFSDNTLVGGITLLVKHSACMCERNEMRYGPYHVSCDIDSFKDTITCPHLYAV